MSNFEEDLMSDEYLADRKTVWVPVEYLLKNATGSCDGFYLDTPEGWEEMISFKASDTGFGHLVDSILEKGFIGTSPIGYDPRGDITEGHHRLTAAILLGLDKVPVSYYGGDVWGEGGYLVTSHYNICDPSPVYV